jgi:hypothetical protein
LEVPEGQTGPHGEVEVPGGGGHVEDPNAGGVKPNEKAPSKDIGDGHKATLDEHGNPVVCSACDLTRKRFRNVLSAMDKDKRALYESRLNAIDEMSDELKKVEETQRIAAELSNIEKNLKIPPPTNAIVPLSEETLSQAAIKDYLKQTEKIGDYSIYGTKGLVGDTFNRNIFLIETENKSLAAFRKMFDQMEKEAITMGANKLSIFGSSVINEGFLNPTVAKRFGYIFEQTGDNVIFTKIFK